MWRTCPPRRPTSRSRLHHHNRARRAAGWAVCCGAALHKVKAKAKAKAKARGEGQSEGARRSPVRMGCLFIIGLVVLGFLLNLCGTNEDRSGTRETPTAASEDEPRKRQDAEQRQREEEEQRQREQEEQRQREQEEAEAARAAIGETVRVGDAEWTVTNAIVASELTSDFMEPKAGNFVIVDF